MGKKFANEGNILAKAKYSCRATVSKHAQCQNEIIVMEFSPTRFWAHFQLIFTQSYFTEICGPGHFNAVFFLHFFNLMPPWFAWMKGCILSWHWFHIFGAFTFYTLHCFCFSIFYSSTACLGHWPATSLCPLQLNWRFDTVCKIDSNSKHAETFLSSES